MATRKEGVRERLLQYAKKEFLEKGYTKASLRSITEQANTSPRAIYTRFSDKEGLFDVLVGGKAKELKMILKEQQYKFEALPQEEQRGSALMHEDGAFDLIDYIYDDFDTFTLLLMCSEMTQYSNYVEELSEIVVESTLRFVEPIECKALETGKASEEIIHILCHSYLSGFLSQFSIRWRRQKPAYTYSNLKIF